MTGLDIDYYKDTHGKENQTHLTLTFRFDEHLDKITAIKYARNFLKTITIKINKITSNFKINIIKQILMDDLI